MTTSPFFKSAIPYKYSIPLLLALVAAGLAGNYFSVTLFFNIDFLFGSFFAMLALQFFGLRLGIVAAAIISGSTFFSLNHLYAIIVMTAEVAVVGWLMAGRFRLRMVLADTLFWLLIDLPLLYVLHHVFMGVPATTTNIHAINLAVNGIANALVARIVFIGYAQRARSAFVSYLEIISNMLLFIALFPLLIMLTVSGRSAFNKIDLNIRSVLAQDSQNITRALELLFINRSNTLLKLDDIRKFLDDRVKYRATLYTVIDRKNNVTITNRTDQAALVQFERGSGVVRKTPDPRISQWLPDVPPDTPFSERWERSSYNAETAIDSSLEWRLIMEQPVAPYLETLQNEYFRKLFLLFLLLLGVVMLAELLCRRALVTLGRIRKLTLDLPARLETGSPGIIWPESGIDEARQLIDDFRVMAGSLSEQFIENRRFNEFLEGLVYERTVMLDSANAELLAEISRRRELERTLQLALEAARSNNRKMSRMLHVVAHEFRTPLGLLTLSTDILDRCWDRLTSEMRLEQNSHIRSAANQLSVLVQSVISIYSVKTENVAGVPLLKDLGEICSTIAAEVEAVWTGGQNFSYKVDPDSAAIRIDEVLFRRLESFLFIFRPL